MLTVADAAIAASRDPETIRRWIRAGRLTAWKVGGQHMIAEDDLAAVLRPTPSRAVAGDHDPSPPRVGEAPAPYRAHALATRSSAPALDVWLPHIVGRIVHSFDPARILLFGGRLHGEHGPDDDYELLVVLDGVDDRWAQAAEIRLSFGDLPVLSEVLVAGSDEVAVDGSRSTVGPISWAAREGLSIYDRAAAR